MLKALKGFTCGFYRTWFIGVLGVSLFSFSAFAADGDLTLDGNLSSATITSNSSTTLNYLLTNTSLTETASAIGFSINLPAGVVISAYTNDSTTCSTGSYTLSAGGGEISASGYQLSPNQSCEFSFNITGEAVEGGSFNIASTNLNSNIGTGTDTSTTLTVNAVGVAASLTMAPSEISVGNISSVTLELTNTLDSFVYGFSGSINLPIGLTLAPLANLRSDCGNYMVLGGSAGDNSVAMSSTYFNNALFAFLPAGSVDVPASCSVSFDVIADIAGNFNLSTTDLSHAAVGIGQASGALSVVKQFVNMSLDPLTVVPGQTANLNVSITNFDRSSNAESITFTDVLGDALSGLVATGLPLTDVCGSGSVLSGTETVVLTNGMLAGGESCDFSIPVSIPANATIGSYTNTASAISSSLNASYPDATNAFRVSNVPTVSFDVVESAITAGSDITLRYVLTNVDSVNAASALSVSTFFGGSSVASIQTLPAANSCGAGSTFTQSNNTDGIYFNVATASLLAGGSCTFDVILTLNEAITSGSYSFSAEEVTATINGNVVAGPSPSTSTAFIVDSAPNMSFSFEEAVLLPGQATSINVALTHSANSSDDATDIEFTLNLGASLTGLVATGLPLVDSCGVGSTLSGSAIVSFSGGALSAGASCSFSIPVQLPVDTVGTFAFTSSTVIAQVAGNTVQKAGGSASVAISGLQFTKSFSDSSIKVGSAGTSVELTYLITNQAGAGDASAIQFTDNISNFIAGANVSSAVLNGFCGASSATSGTTFLVVTNIEVSEGSSCSFTVTLNIPAGTTPGSYRSTSSNASATVAAVNQSVTAATALLSINELTVVTQVDISSPTSESVVNLTIKFSDDVVNFDLSDINVVNGALSNFTGSGSTYSAEVTPSADGDVTIQIPAGSANYALDSAVSNQAAIDIVFAYQSEPLVPTPSLSISSPSSLVANVGPVTYTISYTDVEVVNLRAENISLNATGSASATIAVINGDTSTPTVTLDGLTGAGSLGITIGEGSARYSTNAAPMAGPSEVFAVDTIAPSVTLSASGAVQTAAFIVDILFDENVLNFTEEDISITNATLSDFQVVNAKNYKVTVNATGETNITIKVAENKANDSANNSNTTSNTLNIQYDDLEPSVDISGPSGTVIAPFTLSFMFSEDITGFDINDLVPTNATLSSFTAIDATNYSVIVTPIAQANVVVNIAAGSAVDSALNPSQVANYSVVYDINDAPVISGAPATSVAEDSLYSFTPTVSDDDAGDTLSFSITNKPTWASFNSSNGNLSGTPTNSDVGNTNGIVITVDDGTLSASLSGFNISVTNVNDAPVISGSPATSIAEDSLYSFTPTVSDDDADDTLSFSITNKPTWASFNSSNGNLSGTPTNSDVGTSSGIVITVSDGTVSASLSGFNIAVTNVNDAPVISGTPATSVAEDASYSFTPTVSDDDAGDTLSFSITNKPSWASFNSSNGSLSGTPTNSDVGNTNGIVITVSDGSVSASLSGFNISVTNVNDAPVISGSPATSVAEDSLYSFTPTVSDDDADDTLSFSITNKPTWASFNSSNGSLSGTPTNSDVGTSSGIVITVSDGTLSTSLSGFNISVTNVNDAPVISGTPATSVAEDSLYSFTPTVSDDDAGDTLSFSITNKPTWASFNSSNGNLSGTPTNSDVGTSSGIVITVSDGTLSTSLSGFNISVTNVNDAPVISGAPATNVAEDSVYSFTPTVSDDDAGDTLSFSITNKPTWASFNSSNGNLSGTPTNSDVGTSSGIVLTVSDGSVTAALSGFNISVTNVNDAPVISGAPATSVAEDSVYSFTPTVSDDDAGDTLSFSITNKPSWASFNSSNGSLSGTPTNSDVGTSSGIVITVSDGTLSTSLSGFNISVTNVNDAPVISGSPATSIAEDSLYSFTPTVSDDDADDTLSFSITNKPSWASFNSSNGNLSGTPTNSDVGTSSGIVITVSDGTLSASLSGFNISVTNVNDAPVISGTPATSIAEDSLYSFTPTVSDDDADDTLSFSITNKPSWASFNSSNGNLSGTPTNSDVGTSSGIVITVSDGTLSASLSGFNISVTNVNDAPVISGTPATSVAEDASYSFTPTVSDDDADDTLSFSITNKPSWASFNSSNGNLSGTPTNSDVGSTNGIVITVSDGTVSASLSGFNISVTNVNDVPVISGSPATSIAEDSLYSFTPTVSDDDAGDTLSFSITNKPTWASFNSSNGNLSGTPTNSDVGNTNGIVITVDDGTLSASLSGFNISVTNVNDAPVISGSPATSIAEDSLYSFTPTVSDDDADDTLSFSITNKPTWASFNSSNGNLSGTPTNSDVGNTNGIVITVDDGTVTAALSGFNIAVTNVNDAPVISGAPATSVAEDSLYSFTPTVSDDDADNTLSFSITNKPTWASFNSSNGNLSGTPTNSDVGNTNGIVITVDDGSVTAALSGFNIAVTNVNDAPVISGTPATSVAEDSLYSFTPTVSDDDADDTLSFSITNKPSWASFNSSNGNLSGTPTNSDVGNTNGIVITVSDGTVSTSLSGFNISVTNVNDAPVISGTPATSVAEDASYSFTPTVSDEDADDTLSFSITNKPSWASFNSSNGNLSGTPTNSDVGNTNGIVLTVSDGSVTAALSGFNISVTNVNDAPVISGAPATSVAEDSLYSFTPTVSDDDADDTLSFSVTNKPSWASFNSSNGNLSGTPTNSDVGTSSGIVITVDDGTVSTSLSGFNISVTNVNDAPVISGTPATNVAEDSLYSFTPTVSDDDAGDTLSFSITNKPTWASFNSSNGNLSGTPTNSDVGNTNGIVITVSDGSVTAALSGFNISVTNVNDAPVISGAPATSVAEDSVYSFTPTVSDDDADDTLSFSITNKPSWASFNSSNGNLSGTPTNSDVGSTNGIVITVDDGSVTAALSGFNITVTNVNDAPVISGAPATSVAEDSVYSFTPTVSDEDADDTLSFSITNKPSWASFNSSNGNLSGTPTNSDVGNTNGIVITVDDGSVTAALSGFNIAVTNVNDAPVISGTPATSVAEDASYSFTPTVSDDDAGDTLSFSITNKPSWASFNSSNGNLSGAPTNSDVGTSSGIVITVDDGSVTAALSGFNIAVTNVNDVPVISGTPATSVAEDSVYSFTPTVSDDDADDTLSFSITNKPSWASFNSSNGNLSGTPTNSDVGNTNGIVITVSDGTVSTNLSGFNISVTNVNDAPVISGTPATTVKQDLPYLFTPIVTDDDESDVLNFTILNKPEWANFSSIDGTLSGTPIHSDIGKTQSIVISVSDGTVTSDLSTFAIEVLNVNDAPEITGTPNLTVKQGQLYSFTPTVTDADEADILTYKISNQPSWAQFSMVDGTLSGTPTNDDVGKTADIMISVSDAEVQVDLASFDIEVINVNDDPVFDSEPITEATVLVAYQYNIQVSDVDIDDELTVTLVSAPDWLTLNTLNQLVGTPPVESSDQDYVIEVAVSDDIITEPVIQRFTLSVLQPTDTEVSVIANLSPAPAILAQQVSLVIEINNDGYTAATGVEYKINFAEQLTVSAIPTDCTETADGSINCILVDELAIGDSVRFIVDFVVADIASGYTSVAVEVSGDNLNGDTFNDQADLLLGSEIVDIAGDVVSSTAASVGYVVDMNGDQLNDLLIYLASEQSLQLMLNDGSGQLLPTLKINLEQGVSAMVANDINLDGHIDIVTVGGALQGNRVYLLDNEFTVTDVESLDAVLADFVLLADLDFDGAPELVLAGNYQDSIAIYSGVGTGATIVNSLPISTLVPANLNTKPIAQVQQPQDSDTVINEVAGVNALSLVATSTGEQLLVGVNGQSPVLVSYESGDWLQNSVTALGDELAEIVSTDVDGDNKADLLVLRADGWHLIIDAFGEAYESQVKLPNATTVKVTDLEGDGVTELIFVMPQGVSVWHYFDVEDFRPSAYVIEGESIEHVSLIDLNNNGNLDIVTFDSQTGVSVWYVSDSGTIGPDDVDLSVFASGPSFPKQNEASAMSWSVFNHSEGVATNVQLKINVTEMLNITSYPSNCVLGNIQLTCNLVSIAPGEKKFVDIEVTPQRDEEFQLLGVVSSQEYDLDESNNSVKPRFTVTAPHDGGSLPVWALIFLFLCARQRMHRK
ncbi:putative Ig domain-containing protein [Shewanella youngdeokensis]|uniref:Ig domain-containing protein n=1 Tax=Shewanella youngdeokensis TaxID=2999068 RepID=A0ABZ0K1E4_9GAMM|nr:putative Ig domain-containing protein [Shewanella sp. DAU334]